ncbi:hypothetical protein HW452_16570 [Halomonas aquamarina]|uniref:Uncharacterized protein n=1 Tax=Vreelandella aquamarina TaxID=77097 RepID=A0ACC5VZ45_9GAMM|nr:hypothetical protein [Halomonas aquamarina]MBZ5489135.1 hypothetical protein [Halomonas aquamarina]
MAVGIRVRNPNNGQVVFEVTDSLTTMLGQASTGTGNGNLSVPEFSRGRPFFIRLPGNPEGYNVIMPQIVVRNGRIEWTFSGDDSQTSRVSWSFLYGVYS